MQQPDTIVLYMQSPLINEVDTRQTGTKDRAGTANLGPNGYYGAWDWRVWDGTGFGKQLQQYLDVGKEYSADVHDCGQYISAVVGYENPATGRKIQQSFIIVLDDPRKGDGTVFLSSTKWRTISTINQAANYILSTIRSLNGITQR